MSHANARLYAKQYAMEHGLPWDDTQPSAANATQPSAARTHTHAQR